LIDVTGVSKTYGATRALDDVSFNVGAGEVVGLLGPNGAGKTTLMRIMTGYLQADAGRVLIDGLDVAIQPLPVQRRIGYLMENAPLYHEMSVQRYLQMIAELRQIPKDEQATLISSAVRAASLGHMLTRPIGHLSKGYRQRVGLAQSIVHRPKVLILDEPTVGLDPTQIIEVRSLIDELTKHSTVLLSTHILSEVEAVCDRVIILLNGKVRANAHMSELSPTAASILVLENGAADVTSDLKSNDAIASVELKRTDDGDEYRILGEAQKDVRSMVFSIAKQRDWPVRELKKDLKTLEMVFNDLVSSQDTEVLGSDEGLKESTTETVDSGTRDER
jgi:ABC-2 type transport system ATP-binding protein